MYVYTNMPANCLSSQVWFTIYSLEALKISESYPWMCRFSFLIEGLTSLDAARHGVLPVVSIAAGNRQTNLPLPPAIGKSPAK